jgi:carbon storage regulator
MLVLTRKQGEQLKVGDDVTITVLEVSGHRIRLGIEAPKSTRVLRGELRPWDQTAPRRTRRMQEVLLAG